MTPRIIMLVLFIDSTNHFLPVSFLRDLFRVFVITP
jgi:hypothetical protein